PGTGGHVYYVVNGKGAGLRVGKAPLKSATGSAPASYPYTFDRTERTVYFGGLTNNGDRENFFGAIVTTWPVAESLTVANLDPAASTAQLHLVMQGGIDIPHVVSVTLNDHELGPVRF